MRGTLTLPPVLKGLTRFTSREIAHTDSEAFPTYLQPQVSFVEGN